MYKELPAINLQQSGIDFDKFRYELTHFFSQNVNAGGCNLKHTLGQTGDHQNTEHHTINAIWEDPLKDLRYTTKIMQAGHDIVAESDYTEYNENLISHSPYLGECFKKLEEFTGLKFGRIRLIALRTGVVQMHTDYGSVRYHIPVVTSPTICFAVGDTMYSMPKCDHLYELSSNIPHIAINSGELIRLHLLLVPASEKTTINSHELIVERYEQSKEKAREFMASADPACRLLNESYFNQIDSLL